MTQTSVARAERSRLLLQRLHSWSGVAIAVFMLAEVWVHARAVAGSQAHRRALETVAALHGLWLVIVPLVFHAGYGVLVTVRPHYRIERASPAGKGVDMVMRVSGVATLAFIALHAVVVWVPRARGAIGDGELHDAMVRTLSATHGAVPLMAFAYVLGIAACAVHLGAGLWSFALRWGIAASKRTIALLGAALLGVVLFASGARTVLYLATGWRIGGAAEPARHTLCPVSSAQP